MGKYDNITGRTVDKIWNFIHAVEKTEDRELSYYRKYKNTRQLKFKLKLEVFISPKNDNIPFEIDAGVYSDLKMPVMEIAIHINSKYGKKHYCTINAKLNDIVRHEIEHLLQAGINRKRGKVSSTSVLRHRAITSDENVRTFNYLKLKDEVPANVFGMYRQAKLEKKPLTFIFEEYLDEYIIEQGLNIEQAKHIYKKWYKYSKKHLQKAIYAKTRYS
jgi:hypothetical protein